MQYPTLIEEVKARLAYGHLTAFENDFLSNLIAQVARGQSVTDRQAQVLNRILDAKPGKVTVTKYPPQEASRDA